MHETDDDDLGPAASDVAGLPSRERDYIIPAKDTKGVSARAQCRVQPEIMRMIADIHQSHKYPFRVQGDLIRYCLVSGLRKLAGGAGIPSVMAQADIIMEHLRDEEYHLQFEENFRAMKRVVDKYMERGAPEKARELLSRIRGFIQQMPSDYWKRQYEADIVRKYGMLLDGEGQVASTTGPALLDTSDD